MDDRLQRIIGDWTDAARAQMSEQAEILKNKDEELERTRRALDKLQADKALREARLNRRKHTAPSDVETEQPPEGEAA